MRAPRVVADISPPHRDTPCRVVLSQSEARVLHLLRQGKTMTEIVAEKGFSRATVYSYVRNLIEKFEVRNRLGIVAKGATWDDSWFDISTRGGQT